MTGIPYPKLHPEQWKNSKLTLLEREEVDRLVNHSGWSTQRVAEMFHVSVMTVKYWSDPEWRAKDNARTTLRLRNKMKSPQYRAEMNERNKLAIIKRYKTDEQFREYKKNPEKQTVSESQRVVNVARANKRYIKFREDFASQSRRSYRAKNLNGFRMFQQHINNVSNVDNTCYKKETISTSSYKKREHSTMRSSLQMVRKLHITLQSITKIILQPISVLKRVFSND